MCYSYILHVSRLSDVGDVPANWDKNKVSFIFFLVFLDFTILHGHEWNEEWAVVAGLRKRDSSESLTESLQGRSQQFCQRRSWKRMTTIDNESLSRKNVLFTSLLCNPVLELLLVCSMCWSAIHLVVRTVSFSVAFRQIYKPISKSSHSLIGVREMKEGTQQSLISFSFTTKTITSGFFIRSEGRKNVKKRDCQTRDI